jgi:toxin ParE1/3/4
MAKYQLTNKAVEDLNNIWDYTFDQWSQRQADKYYQMLLDNFQTLADNPSLGKNYEGIANHLFGIRAEHHIIFFRRIHQNEIEITRILHERMDLKNRITE